MMDLLFTHATVVTMVDETPVLRDAYLGVTEGRISYLSETAPRETAKTVKDMMGKILLPGLINTHAHLGMGCLRGYADDYALQPWLYEHVFPAEGRMDEKAVLAGVKLGLAEMTAHGITSVTDMYRYEPEAARLTLEAGLRGNFCNALLTLDPEHFVLEEDNCYTEFVEMMDKWHGAGNGRIKAEAGIHAEYTSVPALWEKMAALAKEHGVGLQLHLSETRTEHEEAKTRNGGLTPAQALAKAGVFEVPVTAAHGVWLTEEDGELLAQKGVSLAHCPVSNLKLGSGVAPVSRLLAQGVNVALGTDSVCSNNILDMFQEMKLAALLQKGIFQKADQLPAWEALKMATVHGAKAQGRDDVGYLACGMQADVIAVDASRLHLRPGADPVSTLVYCASGQDVCLTMVQGDVLYENGSFKYLNVEEILREVEEYAVPCASGTL